MRSLRAPREYARQRLEELKARHNRGLVGLPDPVRVSEVLKRYEDEGIPKLRPASQRRTLGIVAQVRAWFGAGPLHDPVVAGVRPDEPKQHHRADLARAASSRSCGRDRSFRNPTGFEPGPSRTLISPGLGTASQVEQPSRW